MPNHLAGETSPYLLQHAGNPVDWHPWGEPALSRARAEAKPILLSIGYSACHWCHVMAHESFEDPAIAAVMNRHFVNIKVDREERPDLDQIYQLAHQMLAQRAGGWPLTMFLSPDGTPFFGGTYFPNAARHGLPGFADLCERVAALWRERREEIGAQNEALRAALARTLPAGGGPASALDAAPVRALRAQLGEAFDRRAGGFGAAPKFPHPTDLEFLLRRAVLEGDAEAREMVGRTLRGMCEGGLYDQLGGGFYRYSTDADWGIPHFEKMLCDNGLLLGLLASAWQDRPQAHLARCAAGTADWIMREMQSAEGGYFSSLDADSEGEEGRFYVWTREAAEALLDAGTRAVALPVWGLDGAPNFEGRAWHLRIARPLAAVAEAAGLTPQAAGVRLDAAREALFAARERRVRPGRDEKILTAWNALAIGGMARAGRIFGRDDWIASARRALGFVRANLWQGGRLLATCKDGRAHLNAYLDDYAFLAAALLELMQAGFDAEDLEFAEDLAEAVLEQFQDHRAGGFYFTARDHERLILRPKPGHDNATPSGNGVAAFVLQRLAALTGDTRYADAAQGALALFRPQLEAQPAGCATLVMALEEACSAPSTLVLRGQASALADWSRALAAVPLADGMVLALPAELAGLPPVLDKPALAGTPVTAWLCRGATCLAPIGDLEALQRAMHRGG